MTAESCHADLLIHNGTVLPFTDDFAIIPDGAVLVRGERIAAVGPASEFNHWEVSRRLDASGGLILPGLVNTHTHAAMTCFRGIADDLPLMTWLNEHIFPAEAELDATKVEAGALLACAEMLLSGTTCFCDMYLFEDAVARAASRAGIRAVVGEVLFDFPSPHYGPIEKGLAFTRELIDKYRDDPLIRVAVEPHSPYLCAPGLLERAAALCRDTGALMVMHVSETEAEVAQIREKYGCTPVAHLGRLGILGPTLLACHCVVLTDEDIELLKVNDVKVSHNPESNMKLASGIAPVPRMIREGICVGLGTDGCSSNNDLDLFLEMDTAAKLHKVAALDPTVMDARTTLRMATIEGARALGMDHLIGSLVPGKLADVIVIDTRKPHLTPMYQPESHLVYAVQGSDVSHVVVGGRIAVENRVLTTMDIDSVKADVNRIARTLASR